MNQKKFRDPSIGKQTSLLGQIFSESYVSNPINEMSADLVNKIKRAVKEGKSSVAQISSLIGEHYAKTQSYLEVLASRGILKEIGANRYALSDIPEKLQKVQGFVTVFEGTKEHRVNAQVLYVDDMCEDGYLIKKVIRVDTGRDITTEAFIPQRLLDQIVEHQDRGKLRGLRNTFFS